MKSTTRKNRLPLLLFVVVSAITFLAGLRLSAEFASKYYKTPISPVTMSLMQIFSNLVFVGAALMLLLIYRRWRKASEKEEELAEKRKEAKEAKRALEAQELLVEKMKKRDSMKSEFISIVTHELRTPMTPLKSVIEMFHDGSLGELTELQKKYIDMLSKNVERLVRFTTEVLTLSRLESGRYSLKPRMIAVREVLEPVVELLAEKAQTRSSTVSIDIESGISAFADASTLGDVVTNLINNAIVHTSEGTAIKVLCEPLDGNRVEVRVSDNGQGIPEHALGRVFDRFFQADRESDPGYGGTGVGLAVCKKLVEAMSGEISVESRVGEGTTFKFTLPASPPEKAEGGPSQSSQ